MSTSDLDKARANRLRVASHQNIEGYQRVETWLHYHDSSVPLPPWIPTNNLPTVSLKELKQLSQNYSIIEVDYD